MKHRLEVVATKFCKMNIFQVKLVSVEFLLINTSGFIFKKI